MVYRAEAWLGGYTGWVIPGYTALRQRCSRSPPHRRPATAGSGPPLQGEVVGSRWGGRAYWGTGGAGPAPTLRARSVPVGPPWCRTRLFPPSQPITARFHLISHKVSQNHEVSPKSVHKAYHSPCFQNGLRKSPLQFLRFPYSLAFSPKELMGHFDPYLEVQCQNDEVSPTVHPMSRAKCAPDTPTDTASKLAPGVRSSSGLAHGPDGILNGLVL